MTSDNNLYIYDTETKTVIALESCVILRLSGSQGSDISDGAIPGSMSLEKNNVSLPVFRVHSIDG